MTDLSQHDLDVIRIGASTIENLSRMHEPAARDLTLIIALRMRQATTETNNSHLENKTRPEKWKNYREKIKKYLFWITAPLFLFDKLKE